ncbi:MAG TPA: hypothetical protein VLZ50_15445 [Terracidiphilus sp.]|nr:hypothetical protein [Terracidiphilus sp.]
MKPDRPLIVSILFLAGGLTLIFGYANGTAGLSAAMPIANSTLHVNVNTTGPAALGGIALLGIGVLLLLWSLLGAVVSQLMLLGGGYQGPAKLLDYRSSEKWEKDEEDAPISRSASRGGRFSTLGLQAAEPASPARRKAEETEPSGSASLAAGIRP